LYRSDLRSIRRIRISAASTRPDFRAPVAGGPLGGLQKRPETRQVHPVAVDVRARETPRRERVVRRNELPEHEAGRAKAPERLADGRRGIEVARLGDRLLVRGVRAGLLRQEEDEHTEIEVREREPGT